jgi:hypothetical protein
VSEGRRSNETADIRQWLSFDTPSGETLLFDVSFLESNWTCIYGSGCPGIELEAAPELAHGCCNFGAHFTDEADRDRVLDKAALLTDEQWQFREASSDGGPLTAGEDGAKVTRSVEGACIFLNRPGFPAGPGCALHTGAVAAGVEPLEWKPDVCWQIPLRIEDSVDDNGHVTRSVRSWLRRDWGEGGADLGWWCTEPDGSYEAHEPVYLTLAAELRTLIGAGSYARLARELDGRSSP